MKHALVISFNFLAVILRRPCNQPSEWDVCKSGGVFASFLIPSPGTLSKKCECYVVFIAQNRWQVERPLESVFLIRT
jgi:hypothetical protein